ncbi:C2H2-type domain-containing protein [Aphelenchoides besseyi]|nr:C2H2-type domain-containing protein [Aphelenchoides besseyi]KAI6200505.1 C2H2-type domain-containing protein [Aphelenchoides besseyi]
MTEKSQLKKRPLWNPGLDEPSVKRSKTQKSESPPQSNNTLSSCLQMLSAVHQSNQIPKFPAFPFFHLLNAQRMPFGLPPNKPSNFPLLPPLFPSVFPPSSQFMQFAAAAQQQASTRTNRNTTRKSKRNESDCQLNSQAASANPIVDSILGVSNRPVNYNCCAVCGSSFRLTADLVQHVRNQHRRGSRYNRKLPSSPSVNDDEEQ